MYAVIMNPLFLFVTTQHNEIGIHLNISLYYPYLFMGLMSFDAKDFDRPKIIEVSDLANPEKVLKQNKGFYTPLGAGVLFKNEDLFKNAYIEIVQKLSEEFRLPVNLPFCCSNHLKKEIGIKKAIPFCDNLVRELQEYIELVHISYVILPPATIPTVTVGGTKSPEIPINTSDFLRNLSPMFSYITAWNFMRRHKYSGHEILIDGFRSKETTAWDELVDITTPRIFTRGDECNAFISFADIIAFLTDAKLYSADFEHRKLTPENVEYVWEDYSFDVDCHFLDRGLYSKYKWYSNDLIDIRPYLARPIVFLLIDEIEKFGIAPPHLPPAQTVLPQEGKPKKFREVIQRMPPYYAALIYAYNLGGSVQFFDRFIDTDKIRDGDVLVYMGETSKKIALAYRDAFDVEVLQLRELRKKVENMTIK